MSGNQDLIKVETAIGAMEAIRGRLATLTTKYQGIVFQVRTPEGMKQAKSALVECRAPRIEIERERMDAKRWLLGIGKKLDAQAAEITTAFDAIELPIKRQVDIEEQRVTEEKEARIKAEAERVLAIKTNIEYLRTAPLRAAGKSVAAIETIQQNHSRAWAPGTYGEFEDEAMRVFSETGIELERFHKERHDFEAQQAELARQKVEQDERDRVAAEERKREEAADRARQKAERDEHEQRMTADRKRLDDEQEEFNRKREALAQAERDAEAKRQEKLAAARLDSRETIIMVVAAHYVISEAAAEQLIEDAFGISA